MCKVAVALSGGLDSSVALALLKERGLETIGVTMRFSIPNRDKAEDFTKADNIVRSAKQVCDFFDIEHKVIDCSQGFREYVINAFIKSYLSGKTPNPCVECNRYIKFGILMKETKKLGADFLATGHYAKISRNDSGEYILKKSKDKAKDQSYFLYGIKKTYLPLLSFPLQNMSFSQVKNKARVLGLATVNRPSSQEICFIPSGSYKEFLETAAGASKYSINKGLIKDSRGKVLGEHKGICFYTVGQRQGLGISSSYPLYVIDIRPESNEIIVGPKAAVQSQGLIAQNLNLYTNYPEKPFNSWVKIRYKSPVIKVKVYPCPDKERLKIVFNQKQAGVSPGQSVVFYDRDTVLGGGIIEKKLEDRE
jgi:tRNA-uridine 2-sulfurtransferase